MGTHVWTFFSFRSVVRGACGVRCTLLFGTVSIRAISEGLRADGRDMLDYRKVGLQSLQRALQCDFHKCDFHKTAPVEVEGHKLSVLST